ncbi:MAG: SapC family protein [Pseudomonadota bacterium]
MATLSPLNFEQHGKLRASNECATRFASKQHVITMRANEIGHASASMPVFINRNHHTGRWTLSAVTSFLPEGNLFVGKDGWQATWIPILVQCHPIYLMAADDEKGYAVGIDPEGGDFTEGDGEPLYLESGEPSDYLKRVTALLEDDIRQAALTQKFLTDIESRGLLKPVDITLDFIGREPQTITGLHTIDEDKLRTLDGDALVTLNQSNFLILMHAMLTSLNQINGLVRRHNATPGIPSISKVKMEVAKSIDSGV